MHVYAIVAYTEGLRGSTTAHTGCGGNTCHCIPAQHTPMRESQHVGMRAVHGSINRDACSKEEGGRVCGWRSRGLNGRMTRHINGFRPNSDNLIGCALCASLCRLLRDSQRACLHPSSHLPASLCAGMSAEDPALEATAATSASAETDPWSDWLLQREILCNHIGLKQGD